MVSIVHTGGTIASRINYETGGVIASFNIDDILTMFPELTKIARIDSVFFANLMSEDLLEQIFQLSHCQFDLIPDEKLITIQKVLHEYA